MSSPYLPFLYQTRTIQRAFRCRPTVSFTRLMSSGSHHDDQHALRGKAVPFDWSSEHAAQSRIRSDMEHDMLQKKQLTLSPSEAHVFKNIFDEIAEGKMPMNSSPHRRGPSIESPQTFIEHAQMTEFRDKYLERFPSSLKRAAERAMGLFAQNPTRDQEAAMSHVDKKLWVERQKYQQIMVDERRRVEKAMNACASDMDLWKVMEAEVFSLPERLGIATDGKKARVKRAKKSHAVKSVRLDLKAVEEESEEWAPQQQQAEDDKKPELIMDVHGALYSQYLLHALKLFDRMFLNPSPFTFQILPRVKSMGLTSYILGVSTPFFITLAKQHWERYGDANSALDIIQELTASGLFANEDVLELLKQMRDDITSCTIGNQGPFAKIMMETSPYDGLLTQRIDEVDEMAQESIDRYMNTYGEASAM